MWFSDPGKSPSHALQTLSIARAPAKKRFGFTERVQQTIHKRYMQNKLLSGFHNSLLADSKGSLTLRQTGRINDLTNAGGSPPLFQPQSTIRAISRVYRVVLACAMMFPPIGFSGSLANTPVSGFATTWFVTTTATPNSSASFCSPLRNCAKFC